MSLGSIVTGTLIHSYDVMPALFKVHIGVRPNLIDLILMIETRFATYSIKAPLLHDKGYFSSRYL